MEGGKSDYSKLVWSLFLCSNEFIPHVLHLSIFKVKHQTSPAGEEVCCQQMSPEAALHSNKFPYSGENKNI
jgi:hypothetical protein